jgi:2-polyprenyl-3-methyl-5-hydroxy-6-metoxy-1,4-benzoquinol methylase
MKCNICQNEITPKTIYRHKLPNKSDLVKCPECKTKFVFPIPDGDTISEYYNGMYAHLAQYDNQKMEMAGKSMNGYLKELPKLDIKNSKFLDLGGGLGYYSKAAQNLGFSVTLVEQDPVSYKFAQEKLEINNIDKRSIEDFLNQQTNKFDIVFFRHVIEHVIEPDKMIKGVSKLLKKDGILIIETDNNNGVELLLRPHSLLFYLNRYKKSFEKVNLINLFLKKPFAIDPPRHLFAFNMQSLSLLLKRNGLIPEKKVHYYTGHPIYWPNLPLPSVKKLFEAIKQGSLKSFVNWKLEYLFYPVRIVFNLLGKSAGICIYAKKTSK